MQKTSATLNVSVINFAMSKSPLRILHLAPCRPDEQSYGLQQRTLHVSRALEQLGEVTVTVVGFDNRCGNPAGKQANEFQKYDFVELLEAPRRRLKERLGFWVDSRTPNPHGQVIDPSARVNLLESLENYDLVWVHHLRTANVFQHWRWPRSVLDIDDLPSNFQRTAFLKGESPKVRWKAGLQMLAWRRRERFLAERFCVLAVCSEDDKKNLPKTAPVHVIPNGFERPGVEPYRALSNPPRIGFIGPLGYPPNLRGIQWFVKECWPRIKSRVPEARLRLVGKGSEGVMKPKGPDIDGLGWIADTAQEIATWNLMIVPLHMGGGTRLKIAEGFSRKCPIVSTTLGAYGYGVADGRELLLADAPETFASACVELMEQPAQGIALAERAWRQFLDKWTWEIIEPRIIAAAEDGLRRSGQREARVENTVLKAGGK